jgi:hypothetical protein
VPCGSSLAQVGPVSQSSHPIELGPFTRRYHCGQAVRWAKAVEDSENERRGNDHLRRSKHRAFRERHEEPRNPDKRTKYRLNLASPFPSRSDAQAYLKASPIRSSRPARGRCTAGRGCTAATRCSQCCSARASRHCGCLKSLRCRGRRRASYSGSCRSPRAHNTASRVGSGHRTGGSGAWASCCA